MVIPKDSWPASAEQRLKELGIQLPSAPTPFGTYVETVRTGSLLFLSGILQNNASDGLDVAQFANVNATGVILEGNQGFGADVRAHSTLIAINTTVQSNISGGMLAIDNSTIIPFGGTIRNNGADGIQVSAASLVRFVFGNNSIVTNNSRSGVDVDDLSFARFTPGGQTITGNNVGGGSFDVTCRPQFSATRGVANIGGGTTNCVEPPQ
jgi:hypothetical protein